jgi:hypothetical protein
LEVGDLGEADRSEQRRGDRGSVAGGAVDDGRRGGVELVVAVEQPGQGDAEGAGKFSVVLLVWFDVLIYL